MINKHFHLQDINMNKRIIFLNLINTLLVFSIMSVLRSIFLYYLSFRHGFYRDNVDYELLIKDIELDLWLTYYLPYLLGIIITVIINLFVIKIKIKHFIFSTFTGLFLFIFIEEAYLRPLFFIFDKFSEYNLLIHIIFFGFLIYFLIRILKKKNNLKTNSSD